MEKNNIILYILLGVVVVGFGFALTGFKVTGNPIKESAPVQDSAPSMLESITTGTTGSGDVAIELTPHPSNDGKVEIDLSANTHSVSLSEFDLMEITTLTVGGKQFKPVEAPSLSGHHSSGTLVFDIGEELDAFTVTIAGIPQVGERIYTW